jgi:hypothetical protein
MSWKSPIIWKITTALLILTLQQLLTQRIMPEVREPIPRIESLVSLIKSCNQVQKDKWFILHKTYLLSHTVTLAPARWFGQRRVYAPCFIGGDITCPVAHTGNSSVYWEHWEKFSPSLEIFSSLETEIPEHETSKSFSKLLKQGFSHSV